MSFPFVGTHTTSDWKRWGGQNHAVVEDGVRLKLARRRQYGSPEHLIGEPPLPFEIVDLDVDECGDVWLLSASGTVRRYDPDRDDLRRIHCTWDEAPEAPRGIAVTTDTVYVAAGEGAAGSDADGDAAAAGGRLYAFSRRLMQTRWIAAAPYTDPVALARHGDAVSVLDVGNDASEPFLATVGRGGSPIAVATGFRSPADLAVDQAGVRYVLDRSRDGSDPTVEKVEVGETSPVTVVPTGDFVTADTGETLRPDSITADLPRKVIVGVSAVNETEHSLFFHRPAQADFERVSAYTGPAEGLKLQRETASWGRGLHVIGAAALSFLPAAKRTRLNPDTGRYDGQVVTRLDAGEPEVQWHRVTTSLDTTLLGTQVRLFYHATDADELEFREPGTGSVTPLERVGGIGPIIAERLRDAYIQGLGELVQVSPDRLAELASADDYPVSTRRAAGWIAEAEALLDRVSGPRDLDWHPVDLPDPEDALLEDAVGRYLWIKVELIGTATASPLVESLRAYFPRRSYLRYLPAIYRRDTRSAAFLEQYLSLFESVFTDLEEQITASTRYLDPDGTPSEALSWLGSWLALAPDETWSTADERTLIRRAPDLFDRRGTRQGLVDLLSIYLDRPTFPSQWAWALAQQEATLDRRHAAGDLSADQAADLAAMPRRKLYVWEHQDLACIDDPAVRALYEKLLPCPQCFAVMVWPFIGDDAIREVERIVDATSPAHAIGNVIPMRRSLRLTGVAGDTGHHTFLGVNSVVADRDLELDSSSLGSDAVLTDPEPSGQFGTTHRLGTDTRIS